MRRAVVAVLVAVLVLAGLAAALAWSEYADATDRATRDQQARAELAVAVFDTYFAGQVATLQAIATAPPVVEGDAPAMSQYFRRVQPPNGTIFSGGLGWVDLDGVNRATSREGSAAGVSVADRTFFQTVIRTDQPFVSEGLASRVSGQRVIVTAVPTHDADGRTSGVLAGSLLVQATATNRRTLDLGYAGLELLDRDGKSLLAGFATPRNTELVQRMRTATEPAVLDDTAGLSGASGHVVAYATSRLPGWTVVIDRPRSAVFAAARRSLWLELALIAGVALALLAVTALLVWRARRETRRQQAREAQQRALARTVAAASAVVEVSNALAAFIADAVPGARVVVAWAARDRLGLKVAGSSSGFALEAVARHEVALTELLWRVYESGGSLALADERRVQEEAPAIQAAFGGGVRALHAAPVTAPDGERAGAALLLLPEPQALDEAARDHIATLGTEAAQALERARAFEREHDVAVRLQRSLLPATLPTIASLDLAGRYQAGARALEIGGDWYDVVRRPDGIVHLIVGDVAGRGVNAAVLMGQLTTAFRAYAHDDATPGEVMRHLLRHVGEDDMATAVCLTLDPYTNRARYASAGHPPALLRDDDARTVSHLTGALAPPLGYVRPAAVREAELLLPPRATLVAYTDGLVERRTAILDDGIGRLESILAAGDDADADELADQILAGVPAADGARDDVALLIVRLLGTPARMDVEIPATPRGVRTLRQRLRAWLTLRGIDDASAADTVLALSEACNNAIEHGYEGHDGTIHVVLDHAGPSLTITVEDSGGWREHAPDPERGRGIPIMHGLMETVRIEKTTDRTRVTLEQRLEAP